MVRKIKPSKSIISGLLIAALLMLLMTSVSAATGTIDQLSSNNFGNDRMAQTFKTPDMPITVTAIKMRFYTDPDDVASYVKVKIAIAGDYDSGAKNFGAIIEESDEVTLPGMFNDVVTFDFNASLDANKTYSIVTTQSTTNPESYYPLNTRVYLGPTDPYPDGLLYSYSFSGANWAPYNNENFSYHDLYFQILYSDGENPPDQDEPPAKPHKKNNFHELITMLTNPADGSGVRTTDLNYYLRDPVIWKNDVKLITLWLETEIFDLAKAKAHIRLPNGQTLLKDYNIRLMMKIEYTDGRIETREVSNADIARNIPVLLPIDEFADLANLGVVYIDTKGNTAELPVTMETLDGHKYLRFENNHFSEYGIINNAKSGASPNAYTVLPGDTLTSIARQFSTSVQKLVALNQIKNPDLIFAGQILTIR